MAGFVSEEFSLDGLEDLLPELASVVFVGEESERNQVVGDPGDGIASELLVRFGHLGVVG